MNGKVINHKYENKKNNTFKSRCHRFTIDAQ